MNGFSTKNSASFSGHRRPQKLSQHHNPKQIVENEANPINTVKIFSDEKVEYLNKIGHEYPFCVFYKYKANDPL